MSCNVRNDENGSTWDWTTPAATSTTPTPEQGRSDREACRLPATAASRGDSWGSLRDKIEFPGVSIGGTQINPRSKVLYTEVSVK